MMPVGVILDCLGIFCGGLIGALSRDRIPAKIGVALPMVFGSCALALGVNLLVKVANLPPVVLALILGTTAGELLDIEGKLHNVAVKLQTKLQKGRGKIDERSIESFISLLVLFSASANLVIGSLYERMTGDTLVLVVKAILDFFTAMIFATTVGYAVMFISISTLVVGVTLFSVASLIVPYINQVMTADFVACGGIITLLVGMRMMELKKVPVANAIPAILLVMPLSYLWTLVF